MRTVHKFLVPFASVEAHGNPATALLLRVGATIASVGMDPETGNPAVWVEVDTEAEPQSHQFLAFATGQEIPDDLIAVGTAACGAYRWHVYERPLQ